jgi:hypothetical protein
VSKKEIQSSVNPTIFHPLKDDSIGRQNLRTIQTAETASDELQTAVSLLKGGQSALAEKILRELLTEFPNNSAIVVNLGRALVDQDRREEALELLSIAHQKEPQSHSILVHLANVLASFGRIQDSVALGENIIKARYLSIFGHNLDMNELKTFTQKIFARMIMFHRRPIELFQQCADKVAVREYITTKIGPQYLSNQIWVGSSADDIPRSGLPTKFVLKASHGSRMVKLVDQLTNRDEIVKLSGSWLKKNYYWSSREFQYFGIPKQLIIEEHLVDQYRNGPLDYKFYCFHGQPVLIQIDDNLHSINTFYDSNWKKLDLSYRQDFVEFEIDKPRRFEEMYEVASTLSKDFSFVRVDLYLCGDRVLFGELTFTPLAGTIRFTPQRWDTDLGLLWHYDTNPENL